MNRRSLLKLFGFVPLAALPSSAEAATTWYEKLLRVKKAPQAAFFNKSYLPYVHKLVEAHINESMSEKYRTTIYSLDDVVMAEVKTCLEESRGKNT